MAEAERLSEKWTVVAEKGSFNRATAKFWEQLPSASVIILWYAGKPERDYLFFSIIAQVIIEMRTLWLVDDYIISCYNHPAGGDYNTEALIFKMDTARFLDVFEEETNKWKKMQLLW